MAFPFLSGKFVKILAEAWGGQEKYRFVNIYADKLSEKLTYEISDETQFFVSNCF
jgi:uncharacterized protein (DUF952 family)